MQPRIAKLRIRVEGAATDDIVLSIDDAKVASALFGIAIPTDPGRRRIVAKRGTEVVGQTIDLAEGERKETVLSFSPAAPAAPTPKLADVPPLAPAKAQKEPIQASVATTEPASTHPAVVPKDHHVDLSTKTNAATTDDKSSASTGGARRMWGWIAVDVGVVGLIAGTVTGIMVLSNKSLRNDCPNGTCDPSKVDSDGMNTYNLMRNVSAVGLIAGGISTAVGMGLLLWTPDEDSEPSVALWLGPSSAGLKGSF